MTLRVAHVITELGRGGAEMALVRLLGELQGRTCTAMVISLGGRGELAPDLEALGVEVRPAGLSSLPGLPGAFAAMTAATRAFRPHLIHGWLPHGTMFATGLAAILRHPLVWGVRQSLDDGRDQRLTKPLTAALIRLGGPLSRFCRAVIYNTHQGRHDHESIGYDPRRAVVIPNGFPLHDPVPRAVHRQMVRAELGLPPDALLVGMVARWHPMKDHATFIRAAGLLSRAGVPASFLLVGREIDGSNLALAHLLAEEGIRSSVHLLGERSDVPRLLAAMDIACLTSVVEGMPNVVGEAMAAGTPCVATDVGDTARLIGDTGRVVPHSDPAALAAACQEILSLEPVSRCAIGRAARARVEAEFSIAAVAGQYLNLYERVVHGGQ